MAAKEIKVVVADDHPMVREGMRHMLSVKGIKVVGEASTSREVLTMTKQHSPGVVVLDVKWPDNNGIEILKRIIKEVPSTRVIMFTVYEEAESLGLAIVNGASGFILKGATRQQLVNAVNTVAAGGAVFDLRLLVLLLEELGIQIYHKPDLSGEAQEKLTQGELGVLLLVANGFTNKQIAEELRYSLATVKDYIQKIIVKMGVANRAQAAADAIRRRLIR